MACLAMHGISPAYRLSYGAVASTLQGTSRHQLLHTCAHNPRVVGNRWTPLALGRSRKPFTLALPRGVQTRPLSSAPGPSTSATSVVVATAQRPVHRQLISSALVNPKRFALITAGILGGGYAAYWTTTYVLITIPSYVSSFSLIDASKLGFYVGGVVSAIGLIFLQRVISRFVFVRPDPLFRGVFKRLQKDPVISHRLGGKVDASRFKAYNNCGGLEWKGNRPMYSKPRLQLIFQVANPKKEDATGIVSLDVDRFKFGGAYKFNAMAVDFPTTGERILMEGKEEDIPFQGIVRLR